MPLTVASRARFNLKDARILLVVEGSMALEIVVQMMSGFGAKCLAKAESVDDARIEVTKGEFDLIIIDVSSTAGSDLVTWIRKEAPEANQFVPILMLSAHAAASRVRLARDCGAHFIVAKPLTPVIVLERILWIAKEQRSFCTCDDYRGPDRRFRNQGPPAGDTGRRSSDLSGDIGHAADPNLSQDAIDALISPRRLAS